MLDDKIIDQAFLNLRKHKTRRCEIIKIEADYDNEKARMKEMIWNTRPSEDADPELAYHPRARNPVYRFEHGKLRKTYEPEMHEQWLHHIIVLVLRPVIDRTAYRYSCGSLPGKGGHYGMRHLRRMIFKGKNIKYFAKLDIRHFFESADIEIVIKELGMRIKDDWFLHIIRICYEGVKGLVLGFYLSQWLANFLLEPLDRMITGSGNENYVRYMDDIVVFGSNKRQLRKLVVEVKKLLGRRLRLKLKRTWQICRFDFRGKGRFLDFMGFRFYRTHVTIRKRIFIKATRLARRICVRIASGKRLFRKHAQAMISYAGWFSWTDSYDAFKKHISSNVSIRMLKKLVSRLDRRENRIKNERILRSQAA